MSYVIKYKVFCIREGHLKEPRDEYGERRFLHSFDSKNEALRAIKAERSHETFVILTVIEPFIEYEIGGEG